MSMVKLVGYGLDTLILNVRYADKQDQPVKQELDEQLAATLDYLQGAARSAETAVASDWSFLDVLLFVEPHGAGKQWLWLFTLRLVTLLVSRVGSMMSLRKYASLLNFSGHRRGVGMRSRRCIAFSCLSLEKLCTCKSQRYICVQMWRVMTSRSVTMKPAF